MGDRIAKLKELYKNNEVCVNGWRHGRVQREKLLYYRSYYSSNEPSLQLRKSQAEAYLISNMQPVINDFELIIGAPDYHKLDEDEQIELDALELKIAKEKKINSTGGHLALDFEKLLKVGIYGLIEEINEELTINKNDHEKQCFYKGCLLELEAVVKSAEKYSKFALTMAEKSKGSRREELIRISENLKRVPAYPATNFYEAVQSIHFYMYSLHNLFYYGRIDQYLYPYYQNDLKNNLIDYDKAQELIDCLFLASLNYSCRAGTGATIGGKNENGRLVENDITKMVINSCKDCGHAANIVGFAICKETSKDLIEEATKVSCEYGMPLLFNDKKITEDFVKYGVTKKDAIGWTNTGCLLTIGGKCSGFAQASIINLPIIVNECIKKEPINENEFFDKFELLVNEQIKKSVEIHSNSMIEREKYGYEVLRVSCLIDDCLNEGKSLDQGGGRYCLTMPNVVGFANTINSLYTVCKYIYQDHRFDCLELMKILETDYEGHETFRNELLSGPRYGCNDEEITKLSIKLVDILSNSVKGLKNYFGGNVAIGGFAYICQALYGNESMATADGRKANEIFSNGLSSWQFDEKNGVKESLLSVTSFDQSCFLNTPIYNCAFDKNKVTTNEIAKFVIKYFRRGGKMFLPIYCDRKEIINEYSSDDSLKKDIFYPIGPFGLSLYEMQKTPKLIDELVKRNIHTVIDIMEEDNDEKR